LPEITPSNARLSKFGRKLWGDIANEITVTWTNPDTEQEETVTIHDLASIAAQGGVIPDTRNYYGVRNAELALRLALRELRSAGAPLAACDAEIDRSLWQTRPASCLRVTWPEHGLDELVMRVVNVNYGKPGDIAIKVSLVEDVFALDAGDYVAPIDGSGWENPSSFPLPMQIQRVMTLPYYMASQIAGTDGGAYPEVLAGVLATTSDDDTFSYDLYGQVTNGLGEEEWQQLSTANILGHAELDDPLDAEAASTGVTITNQIGQTGPVAAGYVIIGDEGDEGNEIALVQSVGTTLSLLRGVFDTVPRAWPSGTPIWFVDTGTIFDDPTTRAAGEEPNYKLLTRTSMGLLQLFSAPIVTGELGERPWLPNRPANVQVEGVSFNTLATPFDAMALSSVDVDWANRNRLMEGSVVIGWTEATVAPETGQTTKIYVLTEDGASVLATHSALSGTSYALPLTGLGTANVVIVRVAAERTDADGTFESLQAHDIYVQIGGERLTEEGDERFTEEGIARDMED
jgi:hypothetical protein